jgi:predicted esterase
MSAQGDNIPDPHRGQPVLTAGVPLDKARAAMILVHGRGASAQDILSLARDIFHPDYTFLAPQAAGHTWYPHSFMTPIEQNEPYLSSALRKLASVVEQVAAAGIPRERLVLLGFSQGACLTLEFVARNARRYGGGAALTGGLIGPDGTPRDYAGTLAGTPVFIGSSDPDPHIPVARVEQTVQVLERMGAKVTKRIYPGMGHTINAEELDYVRQIMNGVVTTTS